MGEGDEKYFGSIILLRSLTNISVEHFPQRKGDRCCRLSSSFIFYGYLSTDDVGRLCAERSVGNLQADVSLSWLGYSKCSKESRGN